MGVCEGAKVYVCICKCVGRGGCVSCLLIEIAGKKEARERTGVTIEGLRSPKGRGVKKTAERSVGKGCR